MGEGPVSEDQIAHIEAGFGVRTRRSGFGSGKGFVRFNDTHSHMHIKEIEQDLDQNNRQSSLCQCSLDNYLGSLPLNAS